MVMMSPYIGYYQLYILRLSLSLILSNLANTRFLHNPGL